MLRRSLSALAFCVALSPFASVAADEAPQKWLPGDFSGTAALTSNYVFRGISQSDEHPAAQAGITYKQSIADGFGFYLGEWGSSVDFNDGDEASIEADSLAGVTYTMDKWSFDVGGIYYWYPGADGDLDYDYYELQATVGYDFGFATVNGSVFYSPEYFGGSDTGIYYKIGGEVPVGYGFKVVGNVGHQFIDDNASAGLPSYTNWGAGVKYTLQGIDLEVDYSDTDAHKSECAGNCNSQILFTASKAF